MLKGFKTLVAAALLAIPVAAQAGPAVFPIGRLIGYDAGTVAAKSPVFGAWLASRAPEAVAEEFTSIFRKEFGAEAVDTITENTKHKTLVASLHLVRASEYMVPKLNGSFEYHLPVTLSLVFTNPATGDVIYTFTRTSYASVRMHEQEGKEESDAMLRKALASNYTALLQDIVREAKKEYNPATLEVSIARLWKGLAILDKGSKFGVSRGDDLISENGSVKVIHVTEDYAIATRTMGELTEGAKFSKFANQTLVKQLKKPRVLTLAEAGKDDNLKAIATYFEAELPKESAFMLQPVNESLKTVLSEVARVTTAGNYEVTNARMLPDYLIKFNYTQPRAYDVGAEGKIGYRVYEQYVLGELLDRQGRIIYSAVGRDEITDRNVGGMVFDLDARREVLLKNAVGSLAGEFSKSIQFSRSILPIRSIDGSVVMLEDVGKVLRPRQTVIVFRNIGTVDGIPGDVLVPILDAEVKTAKDGVVTAAILLPLTPDGIELSPSKKDVVVVDAMSTGKGGGSDTAVGYCSDLSQKAGELDMKDFAVISRGFGYLLPYSLHDSDTRFFEDVRQSIRYAGFRDNLKLGSVDTAGRCLLPVQKSSVSGKECEEGYCRGKIALAVGYRLYTGQDKKGVATQTEVSLKEVAEPAFDMVVQSEMSKNSLKLLRENIVNVRY